MTAADNTRTAVDGRTAGIREAMAAAGTVRPTGPVQVIVSDTETVTPGRLPKVRDDVARFIHRWTRGDFPQPQGTWPEGTDRDGYEARDAARREEAAISEGHLRVGELYWVTRDMTGLAVSAGATIPEVHLRDRPSGAGLIVFDDAIGSLGAGTIAGQGAMPIDALSWGPYARAGEVGGGMLLQTYVLRWRIVDAMTEIKGAVRADTPVLVPVQAIPIRASQLDPVAAEDIDDTFGEFATAARTLYAAWQLMQQPTLAENQRTTPDKQVAARYARAHRPPPAVTIVDLRRAYVPADPAEADPGDARDRQKYKDFRRVVQGHWRNQPHGPGRAQRRLQFIPAFIKGPDGAPLLQSERVNVWRR